jgi:hypothetical protein
MEIPYLGFLFRCYSGPVSVTPSYLASECLRAPKGPRTAIMRYWQKAFLPINPWP